MKVTLTDIIGNIDALALMLSGYENNIQKIYWVNNKLKMKLA